MCHDSETHCFACGIDSDYLFTGDRLLSQRGHDLHSNCSDVIPKETPVTKMIASRLTPMPNRQPYQIDQTLSQEDSVQVKFIAIPPSDTGKLRQSLLVESSPLRCKDNNMNAIQL